MEKCLKRKKIFACNKKIFFYERKIFVLTSSSRKKVSVKDSMPKRKKMSFKFFSVSGLSNELL